MSKASGLVYIFTGEGKGKTSAALGTMVRALGMGWSVRWISVYKEPSWNLSEHAFIHSLSSEAQGRLQMQLMGKGFYLPEDAQHVSPDVKIAPVNQAVVVDDDPADAHQAAARQALQAFHAALTSQSYELCIFDEGCNAIADGLIDERDLLAAIAQRGNTHVVITGRNASAGLIKAADLVSEIQNRKHPFDSGKNAVRGLDF